MPAPSSSGNMPVLPLRVFLASPGDVTDERALAIKVLEQLQYEPFLKGKISIETVAWDKEGADTPLLASMTPQEAISLQRPKPSDCDVVVVMFWSRMGTPLPADYLKDDGTRYLSGTEWEYLDALKASRDQGRPAVLVYRREEVPNLPMDLDDAQRDEKLRQWRLVEDFFSVIHQCRSIPGRWLQRIRHPGCLREKTQRSPARYFSSIAHRP